VQGTPGGTGSVTVRAEPGQSCTLVFSAAGTFGLIAPVRDKIA